MDILITPERLINTFFDNCNNKGIFVVEDLMTEVNKNPFPIDIPMWYVRDLVVMVILAPVIYWSIKKYGIWFISLLGIIWYFIVPILLPDGGYPHCFFTAALFFSYGAYFSINKVNFVDYLRKFKYAPLLYIILAIIDSFTKETYYNTFFHKAGVFIGVISAVIVTSYLIEKGRVHVNMTLANCSFFVFALHTLIMSDIGKAFLVVFQLPDNTGSMLFFYFITPIITIVLCFLVYIVLKKYFPNICNLLTGGR